MAELIPPLSTCLRRMQAGEKRFARRLASHLEDDYLCWYDLPVGKRQRYADFVLLHPNRGLLLLEVKDWKLSTIQNINKSTAELLTSSGRKIVPNPLEQVRQCTYGLLERLRNDPQLIQQEGRYKGNLAMPYGFGVVLTHISRRQFNEANLFEVLPEHQTICRDEMEEGVDAEDFQKRLWDMFNTQFAKPLTLPQIDRVRWIMFPEVRIQTSSSIEFDEPDQADRDMQVPDLVRVMDLEQEKLARGLGDGHRVIHGVAGSGKTMILGYRCLHLAKKLHKPILVLCYNITLAAHLKAMIRDHGVEDKVNVYHFHHWCGEMLKRYHVDCPSTNGTDFDAKISRVIDAVAKEQIPRGQYGAVLIDEGHDLKPDWLRLITDMVDPTTDSLLLLYDDAQSIYQRDNGLNFSLSSVGVQARGRTTVLRINYRNTNEILTFAYRFAKDYLQPNECDDDSVPLVEPCAAGRHGPAPAVKAFASFEEEAQYIVRVFSKMNREREVPWESMCVTYSQNWMGKVLARAFKKAGIPISWLKDSQSKRQFSPGDKTVKLMTMHSSKGLEFKTVATCGVGYMGSTADREKSDAKLLYVAMTRATENLLVTMSKQTAFTEKLLAA